MLCSPRVLGVIVLVFVAACGSRKEVDASRPAPTAPSAPTPTAPAVERAPPIPAADVEALLALWRDAQNRGDFTAYAALYAARFSGVRRNDTRTYAFDREGWMADRERMFRRAMVVTTSDVVVRTNTQSADVSFVQRWASGSYSDEGPKRMVIVRDGNQLKIAVEEMVAASRLGELDAALAVGTFVAMPTRDGVLAVLARVDPSAGEGEPRLVATEEPMVVVKEAEAGAPAALRALVGRQVSTIERGRVCQGRVEGVRVARLVVPHFSVLQAWEGEDFDESTPDVPMTSGERAREAWNMASYTYYAAIVRSECRDAVAVSFAAAEQVVDFVPREPTPTERRDLVRAFEHTARFAAHERAYADFVAGGEPDEEHPAPPAQRPQWASAYSTVVFEHAPRRVGTVVHNSEGCGGFGEAAWASFDLAAPAPVEHRPASTIGDYVSIVAVFDLEGDGTLEAIVRRDLASWGLVRLAPAPALIRTVDVDYLDCPC